MSKQTKIIIGVVAGISVLCLISCVVGYFVLQNVGTQVAGQIQESTNTDPDSINSDAASIAEFTLPEGFQPETSMNLFGIKIAMYSNSSNNHFISLLQMPTQDEVTEENIRQMRDSLERSTARNMRDMKTIEQRELTIRGKPAQLVIQEGMEDNTPVRTMMVAFQGKDGLAMLMVAGNSNSWDQAAYDAMVDSIR